MADVVRREEELREALLTLERAWERERKLRREYQHMLRSLLAVTSTDRPQLFASLVARVRAVVGASDVLLLEPHADDATLTVVASTRADALSSRWRIEGVLARALDDKPKLVFDVRQLPEYQRQPFQRIAPVRSLLVSTLGHDPRPLVLVCAHHETAAFKGSQGQLLLELRPFVAHALLSLQTQELERERRTAVDKADLLESATDAMGLGLACLSTDETVRYFSPRMKAMVEPFGTVEQWYACVRDVVELPPIRACDNCHRGHRHGVAFVDLRPGEGEPLSFALHFIGQGEGGHTDGDVALVRDVTDERHAQLALRRSEAQLRRAQKLEAMGRLAGGVAHDFNNTLAVILGNSELALRQLRDGRLEASQHTLLFTLLEQITAATRDGAALVNQLLAFSRRQHTRQAILDLNDVVERTVAMLQRLLPEGIELRVDKSADLGVVRADASQITHVLLNLAINARDAVGDHGHITIETRNVIIDEAHQLQHPQTVKGRYALVVVTDDGEGIAEEHLPHIFDPFFSTKTSEEGTGLGLASAYGIVQQSEGAIEVESRLGEGTTFRVYLPRIDPEADVDRSSTAAATVDAHART